MNKWHIKDMHYCPFLRGNHYWCEKRFHVITFSFMPYARSTDNQISSDVHITTLCQFGYLLSAVAGDICHFFSFNTSTVLPPQHTHTYAHSAWNGVLAVYFYGPEYITDLSPMDTYQSDSLAMKIIPYLCNKIHIAIPRVQNYAHVQHKASVFFLYKTHISSVT